MTGWRVAMIVTGLALLALFSLPARALYLDSTIFDMAADKSFISKRVFNDSHKQNIYSISAVKIDKPGLAGSVARLSKRANYCLHRLISRLHRMQESFSKFSIVVRRMTRSATTVCSLLKCPSPFSRSATGVKRAKRYQLSHWKPFWLFGHEK
ncbi:protein YagV [Enterobacter cloacae]|uniref:Protein YagV n=1 Tax=Enterobacter cloacae TaxID=550 RepID=A0A377LWX0_ENTCL|nr:protein YagV [Enterobacter cloacae]